MVDILPRTFRRTKREDGPIPRIADEDGAAGASVGLGRVGHRCAAHPWPVIAAWVLALVLATLGNSAFGGIYSDNFTLPNSPSEQGAALLKAHDRRQGGQGGQLVFTVSSGTLRTGADKSAIDTALTKVSHTAHVLSVTNPFSIGTVSANGRTAVATVHFDTSPQRLGGRYVDRIDAAVAPARTAGVAVNYGGALGQAASPKSKNGDSSVIGIVVALLVLLAGFGSVYAAGLPLLSAGLATLSGIGILGLVAASSTFPKISPTFALMMGLGVGIDYAVFLCTRHRQRLIDGARPVEAAAQALATSGRAVLVAATTVVVALLSLYASGIAFMGQLGVAGAVAVAVGALAALTLAPALLGLIGTRVDSHQVRVPVAEATTSSAGWGRYASRVGAHPWRFLLAGVALLCVLAIPFLSMQLGHVDAGADPTNDTAKRAYDAISAAFGPGANGPYTIAVALATGTSSTETQTLEAKLHHSLAATPDVAKVGPVHANRSGDVLVATVIPRTSPQSAATDTLQTTLRAKTLPAALAGTGAKGYVTGTTSEQLDFRDQITSRLPLIVAVVVAISFLLLLLNFRGPVLALKAAVLNLLSIGAAYGVIVAVFQWGWGSSLLGVGEKVPIESYVPMMMFAIVFGLSMDYEVFLLSRVREAWLRTGDNHASVAAGLGATARVITCAALIMTGVFLAFLLSTNVVIKMLALGLGASILIDATVIRLVVVPAAMFLLGAYNWWTPRWLDRLLPGGQPGTPAARPGTGAGRVRPGPGALPERRGAFAGAVSWARDRLPRQLAGVVAAVLGASAIAALAVTMLTTSSASSQTHKSKSRPGRLTSTIAGTVAVSSVKEASLSNQLTLTGTVGGTDTVTAQASPSQVATLNGKVGANATASLAFPGGASSTATLTQVASSASTSTQQTAITFTTKTAFEPGAPVSISVDLPTSRGPVVPSDAIVNSGGRQGVYVVSDILNPTALQTKLPAGAPKGVEVGRATFTSVKAGVSEHGTTQVLSGLSAGETIVTIGQTNLTSTSKPQRVAILPTGATKAAAKSRKSSHAGARRAARGIDVTVAAVHRSTLTVSTPIGRKSFTVPAGLRITHDGKVVPLDQLHAGDVLRVTFKRVNGKLTPATAALQ